MSKQQDTIKKKNKNKDNNNALSRVGISLIWCERSKKNSVILSQIITAAKLVKI